MLLAINIEKRDSRCYKFQEYRIKVFDEGDGYNEEHR